MPKKYLNNIKQLQLDVRKIKQLQREIKQIKERNARVEKDKEWETSWTRRIAISLLTYLVIVLFFYFANLSNPWINSIVPALGFVLSTLTLSFLKCWWVNKSK